MIILESFGYLHGRPAGGDLVVDLRDRIQNPAGDPLLREMTGLDDPVYRHVMRTPGAHDLVADIARDAMRAASRGRRVRVLVGCQGGRHRSVVVACEVAKLADLLGVPAEVIHHHIACPVINRTEGGPQK
jgi:UPF0042 nucleotide-binding protein